MNSSQFRWNRTLYKPYSRLHISQTAFQRFSGPQIKIALIVFVLFIIGFIFNWYITLVAIVSVLTFVYFADLFFYFFVLIRSFKPCEITVSQKEIAKKKNQTWPVYTLFCPLYHEGPVINQFIDAIQNIKYPKNKLQVLLILEKDDTDTRSLIKRLHLPAFFQTIIVPDCLPKTKPKALNYALRFAKGTYATIYDAEDIPDPFQLKKTVLAFEKSDPTVVCLQAKLNFYNSRQNLLTKLFTAEFALWFDSVLTGLQSINAPIPLGGTSNHFRVSDLHRLKGWDSFNVTEDCDLGIRLAKLGYKTAIIDSTTLEEANGRLQNWFTQRTRWIKGYIQTYFVHMREPKTLLKDLTHPHMLSFQLIIGGKVMSMFINPLMWLLTISYFTLRPITGTFIESLYPPVIFYMATFSLVIGNFIYMYLYMIGCAKRGQEEFIKYVYFIPFYWLAMSVSAWKAVYEMVVSPHYWAKTMHGFHLSADEIPQIRIVIGKEYDKKPAKAWQFIYKNILSFISRSMYFFHKIKMYSLDFKLIIPSIAGIKNNSVLNRKMRKLFYSRISYLFINRHYYQPSGFQIFSYLSKAAVIALPQTVFSNRYITAVMLTFVSSYSFILINDSVAKYYLSMSELSQFEILSFTGKLIYILGIIPSVYFLSKIEETQEDGKLSQKSFSKMYLSTVAVVALLFYLFGPASSIFSFRIPQQVYYTLALALFTPTCSLIMYYLLYRKYQFAIVPLAVSPMMILGMYISGGGINSLIKMTVHTSGINLALMTVLFYYDRNRAVIKKNLNEILTIFSQSATGREVKGKRILIFNWRDIKHIYSGGAEVYIHELAKRWVRLGHHVTFFCGNDGRCLRNEEVDGIHIIRRGGFYLAYLWAFIYYTFKFKGKFDFIIDCQNGIPFFTPLYSKEHVYCLMYHVHQEVFRRSLPKPLAILAQFLEKNVMPFVYKNTRFIAISESTKSEMEKIGLGIAGIEIIHSGIDTRVFRPGKKSDQPIALYLGRLKYYKSLHVFILAAARVIEKYPHIRFVIAGDGEEKTTLENLTKELGLENNIEFLGKVSEEQKKDLMQKAWVFVNPSFMEGWGITNLEANACGTPVVASDVPGLRDSVRNQKVGFLVPYADIDGFAKKIVRIIQNEPLRVKMSQSAIEWARQFKWQDSAQKSLKLLTNN